MRHQTTITLLSLLVLASACNKSNYAQVEPDDLYFSHKDRKEAIGDYTMASASAAAETAPVYTESASAYEPSTDYSSQHAPVLTSPSYGSPTIQQYGQRPYYDETVNPDYIYEQEYTGTTAGSEQYYVEDYSYNEPQYTTSTDPQIVNNYYGTSPYSVSAYANNSYYNMMYPFGYYNYNTYRARRWRMMFYGYSLHSSYSPYYDPFGYSAWHYDNYFNNSLAYSSYYNCYAPVGNVYYNNNNFKSVKGYDDDTNFLVKPRSSRSTVSYYANKDNVSVKQRREDYIPTATSQGGRVASGTTVQSGRTSTPEQVGYTRRSSSVTYQPTTTKNDVVNADRKPASLTVQQYRTRVQSNTNKTVVTPTQNRTNYARNNSTSQQRRTTINTSQPNIGNASYSRQATRNGYNSNSTTRSRSSYTPTNYGSRSRSSGYSNSRSSSYQPRSTSSPSRSTVSPSRSSTPTRTSAPSRSTPTRSSSSSSSSSSRTKRN